MDNHGFLASKKVLLGIDGKALFFRVQERTFPQRDLWRKYKGSKYKKKRRRKKKTFKEAKNTYSLLEKKKKKVTQEFSG